MRKNAINLPLKPERRPKMNKDRLFLFAVISILTIQITGCKLGPKYQRVAVETPRSFRFDSIRGDTMTNISWWTVFNDSVLDTLVRYSLQNNQDVRIAASRIMEARAVVGFHNADFGPKIDLSAGVTGGNYAAGIALDDPALVGFAAGALSYEIDFWGKYRRLSESARAELMASQYAYRNVQIGLISSVISTYFLLLDYRERLKISKMTYESRKAGTDIIRARYEKGIVPLIDLNQAEIQEYIAKKAIPYYERFVAKTEHALSILLGRPPGAIPIGLDLFDQPEIPEIPVGLPSTLIERRPDVAQSEYLLIAQNARIGVAQAERFPAFNLTGLLGIASNDLAAVNSGVLVWSVGGTLLSPLFHWNKNLRKVDIERQRTIQARLQYEKTVLNAFREVEDALVEIATLKREFEIGRLRMEAARSAEQLSIQRYDRGVTSYLEVLESQRQSFNAYLDLALLRDQLLNAHVLLYKALGGGWISEKEQQDAQAKEQEAKDKNKTSKATENPNDKDNIPYRGFRK